MKKQLLISLLLTAQAFADPCGMVPPISLDGPDTNIERIGEQKTYVFYKDGIETIVIHPGFEGNVDEFGMLIPFPESPALRKVSENTFEHLEKAVDPPKITYWLRPPMPVATYAPGSSAQRSPAPAAPVDRDEVRVLNREAVGMYEVAVLEAGSPKALKRWMDDHKFRFPNGMEKTCGDYIDQKWCFVAVKTRVGEKAGVQPRAGMRKTNAQKPRGAKFKGKVQAMGFRFRSEKLEVPMRLSTFNGGDTHNIVYLLADQPMRISNLPKSLVKRQITGKKLYKNLTDGLPFEIKGGTEDDMSPNDWKRLKKQRNPVPHNGAAAELFASDLLTLSSGKMSHVSEEKEKALLDIGERLNLRNGSLDVYHSQELAKDRVKIKESSLAQIKKMHLTVLDGEFDREVLARENLVFEPYTLQAGESHADNSLAVVFDQLLGFWS